MKSIKGVLIATLAIYLAAILQGGVASRYSLLGGHVDFYLIVLGFLPLYTNRKGGALLGFAIGVVEGAMAGVNMGQFVFARVVTGVAISSVAEGGVERNIFTTSLFAVVSAIFSQLILMFLAPPPAVLPFLGDTLRTAVYNGVLAMLLYALFNRFLSPRK
jgi:rod shape-determining protein MreD